jgi:hypothetical protein
VSRVPHKREKRDTLHTENKKGSSLLVLLSPSLEAPSQTLEKKLRRPLVGLLTLLSPSLEAPSLEAPSKTIE